MFTIDEVMTTELITISPSMNLAEARTLMQENRIHHLPVVNENNDLVGLLTLTDVLAATDSQQGVRQRAWLGDGASFIPSCPGIRFETSPGI